MDAIRLYDSELKLMEILWESSPITAKEVSALAAEKIGWNKNTTYTILKKLAAKGYIRRTEPGFVCTPLITRQNAQQAESENLIGRLFDGSKKAFLSSFINGKKLTPEEAETLRSLIEKNGD